MTRAVRAAFYVTLALSALYVASAFAAMDFVAASTEKASSGTAEVTAAPLTFACWFKADAATAAYTMLSIADTAADDDAFMLRARGDTGGDPVTMAATRAATGGTATTSTGFAAGAWHHGTGRTSAVDARAAYLDGGGKGTDTTSVTPASIDSTGIGYFIRATPVHYFDGAIAECGIWNVALTDDEVATLGKGYAPPCVRRSALVAYYPMVRDATSLKDLFSATANHLTLTGGTVVDHPPIIRCQ